MHIQLKLKILKYYFHGKTIPNKSPIRLSFHIASASTVMESENFRLKHNFEAAVTKLIMEGTKASLSHQKLHNVDTHITFPTNITKFFNGTYFKKKNKKQKKKDWPRGLYWNIWNIN